MEYIDKYWAQIVLIITLVIGAIKFYFDFRIKKQEIEHSSLTSLRFGLARDFVAAYTDLYDKLRKLNYHLMFGSWEDKELIPVLQEYNDSFTKYNALAQLIRFSFQTKTSVKIDELQKLMKDAQMKIQIYLDYRKREGPVDKELYKQAGRDYAEAVDKIIPEEIPKLGEKVLASMAKDLRIKK